MQNDLLFVAGVARRLEVSEKTVRRLVARGELPAKRVGGVRVFSTEDIEKFLRERKERKRS